MIFFKKIFFKSFIYTPTNKSSNLKVEESVYFEMKNHRHLSQELIMLKSR